MTQVDWLLCKHHDKHHHHHHHAVVVCCYITHTHTHIYKIKLKNKIDTPLTCVKPDMSSRDAEHDCRVLAACVIAYWWPKSARSLDSSDARICISVCRRVVSASDKLCSMQIISVSQNTPILFTLFYSTTKIWMLLMSQSNHAYELFLQCYRITWHIKLRLIIAIHQSLQQTVMVNVNVRILVHHISFSREKNLM